MRRLLRRSGGQGLVEFALLLPVLMLIVLGIMDFARAYWTMQVITNATREGARVGILPTSTDTDVTNAINNYMTAANLTAGATIAATNVGASATAGTTTTVTVTYPFIVLTGSFIPFWTGTINLSQTVSMRHE